MLPEEGGSKLNTAVTPTLAIKDLIFICSKWLATL